MTFCRSIFVKIVMKLLAFIFEQTSYSICLLGYIDLEIYHIRHFTKAQFVNKGIEFFNLPSISKDKSVISSIPTYFENSISPFIC